MKIYEMSIEDNVDINFHKTKSIEDFIPIAETDKNIDICQTIRIGEKTYSVWSKRIDNSQAFVEEIDLSKSEDELYGEGEIICPCCKNTVSDSWEYEDYNSHFECSYCGSIFSYERIVNPMYNMKLITKGEVIEIRI